MKNLNLKLIAAIFIFSIIGFATMQITINNVAGSEANFTLFDSVAPTASSFLGTIPGIVAVIGMRFIEIMQNGFDSVDKGTIARFFPVIFGAVYFAQKKKANLLIPIIAMIAFNLNPIGRQVWYFSLFWLIPIAMHFLRGKLIFARSLGATFTQHAVGGAIWVWLIPLPAEVWTALIPIVIIERLLIASGMSISYIFINNALVSVNKFLDSKSIDFQFKTDSKYLLFKK
jgi:hypothetical protein